jgi:hypothetical protein
MAGLNEPAATTATPVNSGERPIRGESKARSDPASIGNEVFEDAQYRHRLPKADELAQDRNGQVARNRRGATGGEHQGCDEQVKIDLLVKLVQVARAVLGRELLGVRVAGASSASAR